MSPAGWREPPDRYDEYVPDFDGPPPRPGTCLVCGDDYYDDEYESGCVNRSCPQSSAQHDGPPNGVPEGGIVLVGAEPDNLWFETYGHSGPQTRIEWWVGR